MDRRNRSLERIAYVIAVLLLVSGIVHVVVLIVSGGTWQGPLSLRKPATFGLSFGITLLTIAWTSSFLPLRDSARGWLLGVFTGACVLETLLVARAASKMSARALLERL